MLSAVFVYLLCVVILHASCLVVLWPLGYGSHGKSQL
jgi:hypothetical protein